MTPRTLGLTDPLHQYLMRVGFRERAELKLVREETAQLPSVHMLLAPEPATLLWVRSQSRQRVFLAFGVSRGLDERP